MDKWIFRTCSAVCLVGGNGKEEYESLCLCSGQGKREFMYFVEREITGVDVVHTNTGCWCLCVWMRGGSSVGRKVIEWWSGKHKLVTGGFIFM